jgi:hypothetical protein
LVMLRSITIFVFGQTPRSYGIARGRNLSDDENLRKAEVISDLERTTTLEEVSWRQKARAL